MAQRKARGDGTIGGHTQKFAKKLNLKDRYEVAIIDMKTKRRVRSDASLASIRRKAQKQ